MMLGWDGVEREDYVLFEKDVVEEEERKSKKATDLHCTGRKDVPQGTSF
jgi:hypothetical protein